MSVLITPPEEDATSGEWVDNDFRVNITINHICLHAAESISPLERENVRSEIDLISALKHANDPEFINEANYINSINKASEFLWYSESNPYEADFLRQEAIARWERIQKYKVKLASLAKNDYPLPDFSKLNNPHTYQKLPSDINCKASDNKRTFLNSNYSLKVESDFTLTYFDFPFTDNTLLADGTRFSIVLDKAFTEEIEVDTEQDEEAETEVNVEANSEAELKMVSLTQPEMEEGVEKEEQKQIKKVKKARFKIIWFPKDYIAARERPVNFTAIRSKLGISFSE